jgi:hypothetical protein
MILSRSDDARLVCSFQAGLPFPNKLSRRRADLSGTPARPGEAERDEIIQFFCRWHPFSRTGAAATT